MMELLPLFVYLLTLAVVLWLAKKVDEELTKKMKKKELLKK